LARVISALGGGGVVAHALRRMRGPRRETETDGMDFINAPINPRRVGALLLNVCAVTY
jgi:hypothetical protein